MATSTSRGSDRGFTQSFVRDTGGLTTLGKPCVARSSPTEMWSSIVPPPYCARGGRLARRVAVRGKTIWQPRFGWSPAVLDCRGAGESVNAAQSSMHSGVIANGATSGWWLHGLVFASMLLGALVPFTTLQEWSLARCAGFSRRRLLRCDAIVRGRWQGWPLIFPATRFSTHPCCLSFTGLRCHSDCAACCAALVGWALRTLKYRIPNSRQSFSTSRSRVSSANPTACYFQRRRAYPL